MPVTNDDDLLERASLWSQPIIAELAAEVERLRAVLATRRIDPELRQRVAELIEALPESVQSGYEYQIRKVNEACKAATGSATPQEDTHTRTSTSAGPDYCAECSAAINDWVPWPCPAASGSAAPDDVTRPVAPRVAGGACDLCGGISYHTVSCPSVIAATPQEDTST